jgi:hypothetical protein
VVLKYCSIYFITADNLLSGVDYIPFNDSWKFSTLRDQKRPTHPQSQLASVTWFNGTSSWLYYQDVNSQLREFGLDDYRDVVWRDGSTGPLGLVLAGTGIGASRGWLMDGSEVLEGFIQASDSALPGRVDVQSVWTFDFLAVDGMPNTVSIDAALISTDVPTPLSLVFNIEGAAIDRTIQIWLENTVSYMNLLFEGHVLITISRTIRA